MATPPITQTLTGCATIERSDARRQQRGEAEDEADAERHAVEGALHPGDEIHRPDVEHRVEDAGRWRSPRRVPGRATGKAGDGANEEGRKSVGCASQLLAHRAASAAGSRRRGDPIPNDVAPRGFTARCTRDIIDFEERPGNRGGDAWAMEDIRGLPGECRASSGRTPSILSLAVPDEFRPARVGMGLMAGRLSLGA